MTAPTSADREEFARLLNLAHVQGWNIPDPDQDGHGPASWLDYWGAMERNLELRRKGRRVTARPISPHTPGNGAMFEDHFERALRINRNRGVWGGYLL